MMTSKLTTSNWITVLVFIVSMIMTGGGTYAAVSSRMATIEEKLDSTVLSVQAVTALRTRTDILETIVNNDIRSRVENAEKNNVEQWKKLDTMQESIHDIKLNVALIKDKIIK